MMKKTAWDLFVSTGNTGYYRLYKKLDTDDQMSDDKATQRNKGN